MDVSLRLHALVTICSAFPFVIASTTANTPSASSAEMGGEPARAAPMDSTRERTRARPAECGDGTPLTVSRFGYNFAEDATTHFRLLYPTHSWSAAVLAQTGELLERTYRHFYAEFEKAGFELQPVADRLTWLMFDDEEQYRAFARAADGMDSPYLESYYSVITNRVVLIQTSALRREAPRRMPGGYDRILSAVQSELAGMDHCSPRDHEHEMGEALDVRRTVHETAHLLAFNSGLQKRGVTYPLWVSEGLATNFESDSVEFLGMGGENLRRQKQLRRAHENGRLMPLEAFVTLARIPPTQAAANDLYAQAWGLFGFLFKHRRAELRDYLSSLTRAGAGPRQTEAMLREFVDAFGPLKELEGSWLQQLALSPARTHQPRMCD